MEIVDYKIGDMVRVKRMTGEELKEAYGIIVSRFLGKNLILQVEFLPIVQKRIGASPRIWCSRHNIEKHS